MFYSFLLFGQDYTMKDNGFNAFSKHTKKANKKP